MFSETGFSDRLISSAVVTADKVNAATSKPVTILCWFIPVFLLCFSAGRIKSQGQKSDV
jgi:hypothetical protein